MLEDILKKYLQLEEYGPLAGLKLRKLPTFIAKKRAIINVQNVDNRSFDYALLSGLHPRANHPDRPCWYDRFFGKVALDQIPYSVTHDQISAIEEKLKVGINLFKFSDDEGKGLTAL